MKKWSWLVVLVAMLVALGCSGGSAGISSRSGGDASVTLGGDPTLQTDVYSSSSGGTLPATMAEDSGIVRDGSAYKLRLSQGRGLENVRYQPNKKQEQKIIYNGSMSLNCVNLPETINKFKDKVKEFGGYLGSLSQTGTPGTPRSATFTARVPVGNFQNFMTGLQGIGEMTDSSWDANDVSEEFYDSTARLRSKKVQETRLIELLQKATGKLSEVLSVEKELARIREEIESMEGRLNYLTNQTDFSTVTATIREVREYRPEGPPSIPTQAGRAFMQSIDSVKTFLVGVVFFCIRSLPWLVMPLLLLIGYKIVARKRKPKGQFE